VRLRLTLIVCIIGSMPVIAAAHITGQSFEKRIGDYLVDAGCDALRFVPDEKTFCNFGLIKNPGSLDWDYASFDEVDVTISEDGTTEPPFHQQVKLDAPIPAYIVAVFPHTGAYTMNVRFLERGALLAEAAFPLTVERKSGWVSPGRFWGMIGIGILVVAGVYSVMEAARRHFFA